MASNRDLVEAYAANRRRLIAAFVSGVVDETGLEQRRPWRALVIGLILALVLLAGGAALPFVFAALER